MKSLLESLTTVNEEAKFDTVVANIKALFAYDKLDYTSKEILADMFRPYHGVIWDQIDTFIKNSKNSDLKRELSKGLEMCKNIHTILKP